jgi:hypothetical protein
LKEAPINFNTLGLFLLFAGLGKNKEKLNTEDLVKSLKRSAINA